MRPNQSYHGQVIHHGHVNYHGRGISAWAEWFDAKNDRQVKLLKPPPLPTIWLAAKKRILKPGYWSVAYALR